MNHRGKSTFATDCGTSARPSAPSPGKSGIPRAAGRKTPQLFAPAPRKIAPASRDISSDAGENHSVVPAKSHNFAEKGSGIPEKSCARCAKMLRIARQNAPPPRFFSAAAEHNSSGFRARSSGIRARKWGISCGFRGFPWKTTTHGAFPAKPGKTPPPPFLTREEARGADHRRRCRGSGWPAPHRAHPHRECRCAPHP